MTNTTPTAAAQATVLSAAELDHTITKIASNSGDDQEVDMLLDRIEDHIDALTEQVRVLRENEQERNTEIESAYRRIDKAIAGLRQVITTAHNALADDGTTVDAEYVMIAAGQIESDLSGWMATVGHDVIARSALAALEGGVMTDTTDDAVTLESLREWAKRQADELATAHADDSRLMVDQWKINGMHRAFSQIIKIIDEGKFPS